MTTKPGGKHKQCAIVPSHLHAEHARARGDVRASKMGKNRAIILILIHVLAALHILHWRLAGETLSPLEPSEAMYTIRDGIVNAGAILMLVATLSVLLVGRFFCGWACHLVAIQDFCAWLLKRLGIRPRPLHSRFLTWVPLGAAIIMFGMPLYARYDRNLGLPEFQTGLLKTEFWETFPSLWISIITFVVAGGFMVYALGAKGFCTYACPYGGVFALVEKVAPARIRVNDSCKACGHCTAVCTSNVQVAQEVHQFGMVVDSGCMKCLDCISTCPEDALYFGLGKPALGAKPLRGKVKKRAWQFSLKTELIMVLVFGSTLAIFAGLPTALVSWGTSLHGYMPLLLSLSLSSLTAFLIGLLIKGFRADQLAITRHQLKSDGKWTMSGKLFCLITSSWLGFVIHSGVVQGYTFLGNKAFEETQVGAWAYQRDKAIPAAIETTARRATKAFESAESFALFQDLRYAARLSGLAMVQKEYDLAVSHMQRATRIDPSYPNNHADLAGILDFLGRPQEAMMSIQDAINLEPENQQFQTQKLFLASKSRNLLARVEALEALAPSYKAEGLRQARFEIAMHWIQLKRMTKADQAIAQFEKEFPKEKQAIARLQAARKN